MSKKTLAIIATIIIIIGLVIGVMINNNKESKDLLSEVKERGELVVAM